MKKFLSILIILVLVFALASCAKEEKEVDNTQVNIAALKGPTAIGMVKLMDEGIEQYNFNIYATADMVTPLIIQGKVDIAAVPVNLASILYNKTEGGVQILAVNTLNVLYIVSANEQFLNTASTDVKTALQGKTILATGKGSTPEYSLNELLAKYNLNVGTDVTIEFKSEATEVVAALKNDADAVAMLPQPYVTVAQNTLPNLKIAIDLGAELDNIVTGSIIVRTEFAEQHPEIIKTFLEKYNESTNYVVNNVEDSATLVEKYDLFKAAIAKKAIPYCSIVCHTDEQMKDEVSSYLTKLYNQNKTAVGGTLPQDNFYLFIK